MYAYICVVLARTLTSISIDCETDDNDDTERMKDKAWSVFG